MATMPKPFMKQLNMGEELVMKHFQNIELSVVKLFNRCSDRLKKYHLNLHQGVFDKYFFTEKGRNLPPSKRHFTFLDTPLTCGPSYTVVFIPTRK
jgi:hypothetical protein